MAFKKLGLGGVLSLDTRQAERNLGRTNKEFRSLDASAARFNRTAQKTGRGGVMGGAGAMRPGAEGATGNRRGADGKMRDSAGKFVKEPGGSSGGRGGGRGGRMGMGGMGMGGISAAAMGVTAAMLPLVAVGAKATSIYSDFTKQMSAVRSVTAVTDEQFASMRKRAIELGSTTKFTATEAASGFEELARAGFTYEEQMGAIGGVLSLAAADNMDLGTAADITSNILAGMALPTVGFDEFGKEINNAARVADVLAQTSANSNSNVLSLGEAFKFVAPVAKDLKIPLEDTATALGSIHNAGLKGTLAGTALKNMLLKLAKPSTKATKFMKQYGIQIKENADGSLDFRGTMDSVIEGTKGITSSVEKAAVISELFGLRGQGAFSAIATAIESGSYDTLTKEIEASAGAAERMAAIQMDNLAGQFTLLNSAAEGFIIRVFDMFKGMDGAGLKPIVDTLNAINAIWDSLGDGEMADNLGEYADLINEYGFAIVGVVVGIKDGIKSIIEIVDTVSTKFKSLGGSIEAWLGAGAVRKIAKFATIFGGLAIIASPVALAIAGIAFVISTAVIPVVTMLAGVMTAAFWPVLIIAGLLAAAYFVLRNENESLMETALRVWGAIRDVAVDFWENVLKPLWAGIKEGALIVWPMIQESALQVFGTLRQLINEFVELWHAMVGDAQTDWKKVGKVVTVIGGFIVNVILKSINGALEIIKNAVMNVRQVFVDLGSGKTTQAVKRLGQMLINTLLLPLRAIAGMLVGLMQSALKIPGAAKALGKDKLADAKNLISGLEKFSQKGVDFFPDDPLEPIKDADDHIGNIGKGGDALTEVVEIDVNKEVEQMKRAAIGNELSAEQVAAQLAANGLAAEAVEKETVINNDICIDGKAVAKNQARYKQDLNDRMGAKTSPFVRRTQAEQGSI